jgi:ATP-dependent Clp protease ATP-binding subunit ClpC
VGYDQEGLLTGKVRTHPYSVVLFDEIEKAHPDIFDIFLQIFDEGRLTDSRGRQVSFSDTVIILTSNLGGQYTQKKAIGFDGAQDQKPADPGKTVTAGKKAPEANKSAKWKEYEESIHTAVRNAIRPEILNRIGCSIVFYPLEKETVFAIIDKTTVALNGNLSERGIAVELGGDAKEFLLEHGYSLEFGAREMQRAFERHINEPLAQMILKGQLKRGDTVKVKRKYAGLTFEIKNG